MKKPKKKVTPSAAPHLFTKVFPSSLICRRHVRIDAVQQMEINEKTDRARFIITHPRRVCFVDDRDCAISLLLSQRANTKMGGDYDSETSHRPCTQFKDKNKKR